MRKLSLIYIVMMLLAACTVANPPRLLPDDTGARDANLHGDTAPGDSGFDIAPDTRSETAVSDVAVGAANDTATDSQRDTSVDSRALDQAVTDAASDTFVRDVSAGCNAQNPCVGGTCINISCTTGFGQCRVGSCTEDLVPYCGCGGQIVQMSSSCPTEPFTMRGPCSVIPNCGRVATTCTEPRPSCFNPRTFPEVRNGCYTGSCIDIAECVCQISEDCPDGNQCNSSLTCGVVL